MGKGLIKIAIINGTTQINISFKELTKAELCIVYAELHNLQNDILTEINKGRQKDVHN